MSNDLEKTSGYTLGKILKQADFSNQEVSKALSADHINVSKEKFTPSEFKKGMNEELEHKDVTKGSPKLTAKLTLPHLRQDPHYYDKLDKAGL